MGYYPANMETPGFEDEQRTKPQETKDIEGSVTLMSADQAADCLMDGAGAGSGSGWRGGGETERQGESVRDGEIGVWLCVIHTH